MLLHKLFDLATNVNSHEFLSSHTTHLIHVSVDLLEDVINFRDEWHRVSANYLSLKCTYQLLVEGVEFI